MSEFQGYIRSKESYDTDRFTRPPNFVIGLVYLIGIAATPVDIH